MKKTEETKPLVHINTYEDLVNALGEEVKEFINSAEFHSMMTKMVYKADRRKTCERCSKEAENIYAKDLAFIAEKSTFPYDYTVLCPACAKILTERLKSQLQ